MSDSIIHASDESFEADVLQSEIPVLVDFYADWCAPCRRLAPVIDELAEEYEGDMRFVKVNVDDNASLAVQFGVQSIPTLIFFKGGQQVAKTVGAPPKPRLVQEIAQILAS
ncbi:MAG: thioredoxin [Candidatus Thermoplasmatota archaeon]|nr:thioredoxin [Candidatus Thermoplasmatota archaeon]